MLAGRAAPTGTVRNDYLAAEIRDVGIRIELVT